MVMDTAPQPRVLIAGLAMRSDLELQKFLQERGWAWDFVSENTGLLESLSRELFDLLVLDVNLPEIDLQAVRSCMVANGRRPPVTILVCDVNQGRFIENISDLPFRVCEGRVDLPLLEKLALRGYRRRHCREGNAEQCIMVITAGEVKTKIPELPIFDHMLVRGCIDYATKQRLVLAFQEAFTNSLDHGSLELASNWKEEIDEEGQDIYTKRRRERLENPNFATRKIRIRATCDCGRVSISVADEGPGFPLGSTCDTLLKDGAMSFHGRGLAIIGSIMDEVFFNEEGTEITMIKYLD